MSDVQRSLPLAFETTYASRQAPCIKCRTSHGVLTPLRPIDTLLPKDIFDIKTSKRPNYAISRKIISWDNIPVVETITGYVNLHALLLTTTDMQYADFFSDFMHSKQVIDLQLHLWKYYECQNTILSGTTRLSHYTYDVRGDSIISYRERIGNKKHIHWMHPYLAISYREMLKFYRPDAFDVQTISSCVSPQTMREYHHFCVDMGFVHHDIAALLSLKRHFPSPHIPSAPEFIYLIQRNNERIYKIGMSRDPGQRLKNLQGANSEQLKLLHVWKVQHAGQVERELHRIFTACRLKGEWFALSTVNEAELLIYMKQYKDMA